MLAAPEAAAWAAHPAARTGKLEKRGRLKDEWKARHFELRGCYLVCFADAKEGRPALAVFDVTKVACARDANDPEEGPFVAAKDPSALSQVAKSHLEIIVAVGEAKQRHAAELAKCADPIGRAVLEREHSDIINEAVGADTLAMARQNGLKARRGRRIERRRG